MRCETTIEELAQSGRPIAGVILNRVASREAGYYYYAYGQAYGDDARDEEQRRAVKPRSADDVEAPAEAS